MARERNVDLVEVAPQAAPPVCRLMDYGKFRYEQAKKEREARKHLRPLKRQAEAASRGSMRTNAGRKATRSR